MTKPQDFTAMFQDMFKAMPFDTSAFDGVFKQNAELAEKMSAVALNAAAKSSEISTKWTNATLEKMTSVSKAQEAPEDVSKAMTEFASASAEMAAEHMAAFAEVAKKVQLDTVDLVLSAGKDASDDATAMMQKAAGDVSKAAKKAATAK